MFDVIFHWYSYYDCCVLCLIQSCCYNGNLPICTSQLQCIMVIGKLNYVFLDATLLSSLNILFKCNTHMLNTALLSMLRYCIKYFFFRLQGFKYSCQEGRQPLDRRLVPCHVLLPRAHQCPSLIQAIQQPPPLNWSKLQVQIASQAVLPSLPLTLL